MTAHRLRAVSEGWFWQLTVPARRALRRLRREVSILRRRLAGESSVVFDPPSGGHPVERPARWHAIETPAAGVVADGALGFARLVGDLENLAWIVAGPGGPLLLRTPDPRPDALPSVTLGRILRHRATPTDAPTRSFDGIEPWNLVGDRALFGDSPRPPHVRRRAARLAASGDEPGGVDELAAVLLLPFLAVGGAERLLLEYIRAVSRRRHLAIATTEPHRGELGSLREAITPHAELYPLGDALDRPLHAEALSALLRRRDARVLAAWNGCALFYEHAPRLRRELPGLRIVNQIFDHRMGWIRRITPSLRRAVDTTIAVNLPIAEALIHDHGVPAERVALVRHGVAPADAVDESTRHEVRRELGIPRDAVVAASFLRFHPQKRPGDLLAVARRLEADRLWLLLVGGGPLDGEIADDLARRPAPNVVRRPLDPDPSRYFAAVDFCLMASEYEGLPLFLLEGMSRGLPAVATAVGEIPELLADGAGLVVPPGDVDGLSKAARAFLDPERRRVAGEIALRVVRERHSLERFVAETDAAIFGTVSTGGAN